MVDHDHDRIETTNSREVHDKVHGEVLERVRSLESKGGGCRNGRVGEHFMCLADHAARDILLNVYGEAQPSIVLGKECDCLQVASMTILEGAMGGGD